jgi:hypothetical protein
MRLWVESARQSLGGASGGVLSSVIDGAPLGGISTLTTEEDSVGLVVTGPPRSAIEACARAMVNRPWSASDVDDLLAAASAPGEGQASFGFLQVRCGDPHGAFLQGRLVECDAPPLCVARQGRLVLLPVIEEELRGRLVRRCEFDLRDGDHLAMVSSGYLEGLRAGKSGSNVGWREVAAAVRRLTETRCSAEQLAAALIRQYERFAGGAAGTLMGGQSAIDNLQSAIAVLAMFVRPMRSVTVWSGPPADRAADRQMLDALMAEEDLRVVCGDTTAEIAARMLGAELVMEPRPQEGWAEVPPVSRMILPDGSEPVAMVTEGVVTMRAARERLEETARGNGSGAARARNLLGRADGASRLAAVLLTADKVRFLAGMAINPAQVSTDGSPLRRKVVEELSAELKALGKFVSIEYFGRAC